jgi:hypothetical protein
MELLITSNRAGDDWSVWATLEGHDAIRDSFGFIIGVGATRDAAVADAVRVLKELSRSYNHPAERFKSGRDGHDSRRSSARFIERCRQYRHERLWTSCILAGKGARLRHSGRCIGYRIEVAD